MENCFAENRRGEIKEMLKCCSMSFNLVFDGRGGRFTWSIVDTYSLAGFFDGWQAGTGLELQVQQDILQNICIRVSAGKKKKQALKLKSQSKMERHLSSVFNAGRPLHCDADKRHLGSTSGD